MKKRFVTIILAGALTVSSAFTAFAGWEQTGTTWKYQNADKTYMTNTWNWIDGNGDNVAECYYFGADGIMFASTTVEGYTVNENGAWTVNGIVQTKSLADNTSSHGSTGQASVGNVPTNQPTTPETPTPTPPSTGGGNANPATNPENSWFFDGWDPDPHPVGGDSPQNEWNSN